MMSRKKRNKDEFAMRQERTIIKEGYNVIFWSNSSVRVNFSPNLMYLLICIQC